MWMVVVCFVSPVLLWLWLWLRWWLLWNECGVWVLLSMLMINEVVDDVGVVGCNKECHMIVQQHLPLLVVVV